MPELPETHTIASVLDKNITGLKILRVSIAKNYKAKPSNEIFIKAAAGKKIKSVKRVAKNILIELEGGNHILFHLAMTGRLLIWKNEPVEEKSIRVILHLENDTNLTFSDVRMFGKAAVLGPNQVTELGKRYGPSPLDENLAATALSEILSKKKTSIKNVLLDQKIIAGMGNIYATDALFLSSIHPKTKASLLDEKQLSKLAEAMKQVLTEGIEYGGATLDDKMYVDPFRKEGKYQEHFKIYSRKNCPNCGGDVSYILMSGRGTYFCPVCQPEQQ